MSARAMAGRVLAMVALTAAVAAQEPAPLAQIGQERITLDQFLGVLRTMRQTGQAETTLQTLTPAGRERLLNALIDRQLYAIGAREDGLDREPDVRFRIEQAVNEVLAQAYLQRATQQVAVTDAALEVFYAEHRDAFVTPLRAKVRHIVLASRDEAESVLKEARSGADFAALARSRSIDEDTRESGGAIGWVTRGVMVKAFEDAVFALKPGEIGGPVQTAFGFHVMQVEERQVPEVPALASVKQAVRDRKIAAELAERKTHLQGRHPVTIQRELLIGLGSQGR